MDSDSQEAHLFGSAGLAPFESSVVQDLVVRMFVNGRQVDTLTCSPWNVEELTYGRLYFDGIINQVSDITDMRIDVDAGLVDVLISDMMGAAPDSLLREHSVLSYYCRRGAGQHVRSGALVGCRGVSYGPMRKGAC